MLQMRNPESCNRSGCSRPVSTTFRQEALCLDHFCIRSYEMLDALDKNNRLSAASRSATTEQMQIAEECARRTLDICMSKMLLNNLERARLLDILLWCGDVVNPRRLPSRPAGARLRYEIPARGRETSSGTSGQ
jgi:hypothetical protein